jgi:Concanavalin A-like lectin/glucanases superfamily
MAAMRSLATSALALLAGCGQVAAETGDALVDDGFDGRFGAGVFAGTRWVGDHVELDAGVRSGTFVSRVFDSGVQRAAWNRLSWRPGAPYGKPLPDGGRSETGYRAGNVSMQQNVLLAHFDDKVQDDSPSALALVTTKPGGFGAGVFGAALTDTADSYVYATVRGMDSPLNFGAQDFSWSLWARSTAACPGNAVFMGLENPDTGLRPHLWLGCTDSVVAGSLGNTFCTSRTDAENDCVQVPGKSRITDGAWHHLAIVKAGQRPGTVTTYVDGALQGQVPSSYASPLVFDDGVQLAIGAFSGGSYPAAGDFDEAAVWRRALSEVEVAALYRRGAQRLLVQVRACEEPTCTAVSFAGPGGDPQRWYVEPANAESPGQTLLATPVIGRYVQYQVRLESELQGMSPELYEMSLGLAL